MRYHIYKATRSYEGRGYQGPSSNNVLCEFDSIFNTFKMYVHLCEYNSGVGWNIFDTKHQEKLT